VGKQHNPRCEYEGDSDCPVKPFYFENTLTNDGVGGVNTNKE